MAKNQPEKKEKSKLDIGKFFKGLLKSKKKAPEADVAEEKTSAPEAQEEQPSNENSSPQSKPTTPFRPRTTAAIEVAKEDRVFQHIAVIGPSTGALHNMVQILMRRGYDVDYLEMMSSKRGTFEKHELSKEVEPNCECLILFEPSSIDQAKSILKDIRKAYPGLPMLAIGRQFTTPNWANEILKEYQMTNRFLIRFSFTGLLKLFNRIKAEPVPSAVPPQAPKPAKPKPKLQPKVEPTPTVDEDEDLLVVEKSTSEIEETPPATPSEPPVAELVEVGPEELHSDIEKKSVVISESTLRPMAKLADYANESRARYKIDGREDEGIDPDRLLTRKEFENLFQTRVQEQWRIELVQDPKAMPPIVIELIRVPDDASGEAEPEQDQIEQESTAPAVVEKVEPKQEPAPSTPALKLPDLSDQIKEVRKWWQTGRMNRIYNEMEAVRRSTPEIANIDTNAFLTQFLPLLDGTILFAKGRLDRTIETTLEELFHDDISRNGLSAPLRLLALIDAVKAQASTESLLQSESTIVEILKGLIPEEDQQEQYETSLESIREYLHQLDQLVDKTLDMERVAPVQIFDYFENLQKITVGLHKQFSVIDPELCLFGRLDTVIVRSQVRSDWAFDHTEQSEEWHDRLVKFLHFLAEIRINIYQATQELDLLGRMFKEGLESVREEVRNRMLTDTLQGETLERIDKDHLKEPRNETIWHIRRHWGNYLIDLMNEENDTIKAFTIFDEESITYTWLGLYHGIIKTNGSVEEEETQSEE